MRLDLRFELFLAHVECALTALPEVSPCAAAHPLPSKCGIHGGYIERANHILSDGKIHFVRRISPQTYDEATVR